MNFINIAKIIGLIIYLTFIIFIFVGGGFITKILFKNEYDTSCVGINNKTELNIAKLTIVMFWIIFILLFLASVFYIYVYTLS